jgi:hypothetical protein
VLVATVLAGLGAWTVHVLLARRPIAAKGPADGCPPSVLSLACQGRHPVADITPSGRITAAPTEREVELQQGSHRARNNPLLISSLGARHAEGSNGRWSHSWPVLHRSRGCGTVRDRSIRPSHLPERLGRTQPWLRAWAPVYSSLEQVLGSRDLVRLHGNWRQHQDKEVRDTLADDTTHVCVAEAARGVVGLVAAKRGPTRGALDAGR